MNNSHSYLKRFANILFCFKQDDDLPELEGEGDKKIQEIS
jgi:hypothetical protein